MFQLKKNWPFEKEVTIRQPGGEEATFTAHFVIPEGWKEPSMADMLDGLEGDLKYIREVFVGWGPDLKSDDGKPLTFTEELRENLIALPFVRVPLIQAFRSGVEPEIQGN